jgi:NADH pyrophosphatase NudC (nudix superfamily)
MTGKAEQYIVSKYGEQALSQTWQPTDVINLLASYMHDTKKSTASLKYRETQSFCGECSHKMVEMGNGKHKCPNPNCKSNQGKN